MPIAKSSADSLLSQAIAAGASIDTLERLMVLRKEMLAEDAKIAFNKAMSDFQSECPVIQKTKGVKTKDGRTAYKYAPIESIVAQVKDIIQKHGFRYTTTMELHEEKVKALCRVVHELGHEEVSEMEVPLGTKTQIMSDSQVVAAASTFAKRYAFLNAFGIMTGDEDNDSPKMQTANPSVLKDIAKFCEETDTDYQRLCAHYNVVNDQWTELAAQSAIASLKKKLSDSLNTAS